MIHYECDNCGKRELGTPIGVDVPNTVLIEIQVEPPPGWRTGRCDTFCVVACSTPCYEAVVTTMPPESQGLYQRALEIQS